MASEIKHDWKKNNTVPNLFPFPSSFYTNAQQQQKKRRIVHYMTCFVFNEANPPSTSPNNPPQRNTELRGVGRFDLGALCCDRTLRGARYTADRRPCL